MTKEDIKVGVELDISSISKAMDELISLSSSVNSVIVKLQNYALAAAMTLAEGEVVKCAEKYLSAWPITR